VYADYTASGRALGFIERFIADTVLPHYANTHTEASATGRITSHFREEARSIILHACGGNPTDHAAVFVGSGSTAAINLMVGILNMKLPAGLEELFQLSKRIPPKKRPVVFIGPYEHHSNELSWRESIADVVTIPLNSEGGVDLEVLVRELVQHRKRPLLVCSFSAGSNVTC
jgi:selenocysteine lyase/cysteine desulfurase